jgi:hypothetical protein
VIGLLDRFGEDRSEAFRRGIDNELGNLWRAMKKHWASRNTDKDVTDWLKSSARSW